MLYIISYDLIAPGQDYEPLWAELNRLGAKRVLQSQWAVRRTNTNPIALRDHLKRFIDANDRLLVTAPRGQDGWASWRAMFDINDV